MYFLIGADGREYGPFSAEQIRDGETTWQALKDFAEFADASNLSAAPPPGTPPPALSAESIAVDYLSRPVSVDVASCINRGWVLVRDNPGLTIGGTLLVMLVSFGLAMLPVIGLLAIFINPVLFGGLAYTFTRRIRGDVPSVGDAFCGFSLAFLQLGLAGLVSALLICVGLLLCVLPGIYLAVGYTFALPLVIDKKYDFWAAMEVSRRVVHKQWWTLFGLLIVAFLINVIGILACFVGWIVAAPVSVAAIMYAYEDLFGQRGNGVVGVTSVPSPQ
jgi:hypothetical protein